MDRNEADAYLSCAMDIGKLLLENGAEVNRVEDTIRRIMSSQGIEKVEVFSITSNITATAHLTDLQTVTQMRRIYTVHTNMTRLEGLNQLSRDICSGQMTPAFIHTRIDQIVQEKGEKLYLLSLGYAIVSGSFALFFGGNVRDFAASASIGFLLFFVEKGIARLTDNLLMTALLWSTAGGILSLLSVAIGLGSHADLISIGNIMLFIPGIAFTNSIRDLFLGDTITGLIRFMESILLAVIIAVGFTLVGKVF